MAANLKLVKDEYPHRLSPLAITFTEEIKRMTIEKGIVTKAVMTNLSKFTGVCESQLYNYRMGKTSIPADLIPVFCKQFESNALAMTLLNMCNETPIEEREAFDLTRLCSSNVRDMLQFGDQFMEALDDGQIDGHEETKLSHSATKIVRGANRMLEAAREARKRRMETSPAAA